MVACGSSRCRERDQRGQAGASWGMQPARRSRTVRAARATQLSHRSHPEPVIAAVFPDPEPTRLPRAEPALAHERGDCRRALGFPAVDLRTVSLRAAHQARTDIRAIPAPGPFTAVGRRDPGGPPDGTGDCFFGRGWHRRRGHGAPGARDTEQERSTTFLRGCPGGRVPAGGVAACADCFPLRRVVGRRGDRVELRE